MLQTAASLVVEDGSQSEPFALEQPEFSNGSAQRRRPGIRKRKRRPQSANTEGLSSPTALNSPPYWRGQVEDSKNVLNPPFKSPSTKPQGTEEAFRPSLQTSFKRRKQPAIREPLAALEKEQKLYEMRNKPETHLADGNANSNSANLKNILKNSGGLSLSEILQQKNLSLDDLLKGKQNALQALQTTATAPQEKINHAKYPSFKGNYKTNPPITKVAEESSEEVYSSKDRSKLSALQRLKLFGSSSRPIGSQVSLADHLTTRKREGALYTTSTTTTNKKSITKSSTTKIPLYKKILHQRPTLKPTFLLKHTGLMASAEPERVVTSWDSKELERVEDEEKETEELKNKAEEVEEDIELIEDAEDLIGQDVEELTTQLPETTTWNLETTITPSTTSYSTTTSSTSTPKPTTEKSTNTDRSISTRRMFTSTRGSGRTTYRYSSSPATTSTTSTTSTTTTTTTPLPMTTTTTTTSTTTASSSTMNLTPKANLNLNTEDLRERIQETLLKNLIEKEDSYKKSPIMEAHENENDDDDDLENFFEETVKPKSTKYIETSTITTRMRHYTPSFIYTSSTSTTSSPATTFGTPTDNVNVMPDFDNVDDRTDLLELIEDRRSGNRLFKVLEQRNMTLEELIEHRKRGSSQLHLATIVESPSRFYPDKKVVLQDNMDIVTAFENFPHFNLLNLKSVKPDDIKTDSQGSSYFTSIIDIEPTDEVYKNRKRGQPLSAELEKDSLPAHRTEKSLGFFPSWKTLALASLATPHNNKDAAVMRNTDRDPYFLQQPKMLLENNSENNENDDEDIYEMKENELSLISRNDDDDDDSENDYQAQNPIQAAVRFPDKTVEDIENEVARAHDLVELELSGHGFKRSPQAAGAMAHSHRRGSFYANMPSGVKSAIVASATIVLTALVTFMVIFAVCKWKQRRHRMTNIMKSYNAMKNKLPTIAATSTGVSNAISRTNPNSRRSSFREMQDLLGGSGLSVEATITTTSTGVQNTPIHTTKASSTPVNTTQTDSSSKNINSIYGHNSSNNNSCSGNSSISCGLRPFQRQSSLLFQRSFNQNSHNNNENPTNLSVLSGCNLSDLKRNNKINGSTTSLSFSLTSGHNISNSHINTMDANSPEVQEYLFDTLRNSF